MRKTIIAFIIVCLAAITARPACAADDRYMIVGAYLYAETDRQFLPMSKNDKDYEAFTAYLDRASEYLEMAIDETPFDVGTDPGLNASRERRIFILKLSVVIIVPIALALSVCLIWLRQMKTAKAARPAHQYIPKGGFNLTMSEDRFLYRTERRVRIKKSSSSGGGTSVGSGGSSGRSG